ncbi:MAG: hypothetical protein ACLUKN_06140 [Bacilli bacterium]
MGLRKELKIFNLQLDQRNPFFCKKLTGKPGQNDMLWIREGGYHLDIDRDLSVKTFKVDSTQVAPPKAGL